MGFSDGIEKKKFTKVILRNNEEELYKKHTTSHLTYKRKDLQWQVMWEVLFRSFLVCFILERISQINVYEILPAEVSNCEDMEVLGRQAK